MRTKTMNSVRASARWILGLLDARLPMTAVYGLRTR
jgi:hypothetical protein